MAKQVKLRRGTTAQVAAMTPAVGEAVVDTDKDTICVGDGATAGGHELLRADGSNADITNAITVSTGSSGAAASSSSDELVVESSTTSGAGISVLVPDTGDANIYLGSASDSVGALIRWEYNQDRFRLASSKVGASLRLDGDDGVTNLTLSGGSGSELAEFAGDVSTNGLLTSEAGAATDATTLATAVSTASTALKTRNDSSAALWASSGGSGKQILQAANGSGTTSYDLLINPFGGNLLTGAIKASTGSSGATASSTADEGVFEGSGTAGITVLGGDASNLAVIFGSSSESTGFFVDWNHDADRARVMTSKVGARLELRGDNEVTNLTLSGASGSELATAAGSVSVTDFLRLPYSSELTVASGVVTATGSHHFIDTEADAASDDLDTINGGTAGDILLLRSANNSRDPTLKDGSGNLRISGDFTLTNSQDTITLLFDGSNWLELSRSDNT